MGKILTSHVGSLPRSQEVVDFIFAREKGKEFAQVPLLLHCPIAPKKISTDQIKRKIPQQYCDHARSFGTLEAVSYTHLTLPTKA